MTSKTRKKYATKEELLKLLRGKAHLRRREVEVPEWGLTIHLQEMTAEQNQAIYELSQKEGGLTIQESVDLLVHAIVDKEGEPLFDTETIHELHKASGRVVTRLVSMVTELNREEVEEEKKDSETHADDSATS